MSAVVVLENTEGKREACVQLLSARFTRMALCQNSARLRTPNQTFQHKAGGQEEPRIFSLVSLREREVLSAGRNLVRP